MSGWIPVGDKSPKCWDTVFVQFTSPELPGPSVGIAEFANGYFWSLAGVEDRQAADSAFADLGLEVTHWQPIIFPDPI